MTTKKRDATKTRENILKAAQLKFMEYGFDSVGVREIAEQADVNVALVNRYFGSKEGLFKEAVIPYLKIEPLLKGDKDFIGNMCHCLAYMVKPPMAFDPMVAILRSIGSEKVSASIREAFEQKIIHNLSTHIESDKAVQKAAIISAMLFGYDSLFRLLKVQFGDNATPAQMEIMLNKAFRAILSDDD